MPELGERRKSMELGYKNHGLLTWVVCPECSKGRWFKVRRDRINICRVCSCKSQGEKRSGGGNGKWKGGRVRIDNGRIGLKLQPDDFFYPMMRRRGYVLEHRLVVAKHLGRCLQPWEIVHHKNGDKTDNRIENLELTTNGAHIAAHNKGYRDGYTKGLQDGRLAQIEKLKSQIQELELQLSTSNAP